MTGSNHKYEIFIKASARPVDDGMMQSVWSWRKIDAAGFVLVRGTDHGSMVYCLRAARTYRGNSDDAPIGVELLARDVPDAAGVVYLGASDAATQLVGSGFGVRPVTKPAV